MMRTRVLALACAPLAAASISSHALAQESRAADSTHAPASPIQDNSFLIEEAYNQETGIVQHIFTFQRENGGGGSTLVFTQEWPVRSVKHQLSYTLPVERADAATGTGVGDIGLNYRYQAVGDGNAVVAIAPRLTAVLPTGQYQRGRGAGALGVEAWLPVSIAMSRQLVAHLNLGTRLTPDARQADGARATTRNWAAGGSLVWLAQQRLNFLVEAIYQENQSVVGPRATSPSSHFTLSPGVRWAYDFASGLQIVPGIAVPLGMGPSHGERSAFVYLSFEHPFTK